jgi:hypothetical protein
VDVRQVAPHHPAFPCPVLFLDIFTGSWRAISSGSVEDARKWPEMDGAATVKSDIGTLLPSYDAGPARDPGFRDPTVTRAGSRFPRHPI